MLVEGSDDCHVVLALCVAHRVPETFGIYECGSDVQLLRRLNALIIQPDPPSVIGVVLDADSGVDQRWASIKAKLSHYDYRLPDLPAVDGTIIEARDGLPKLGVWLMPNNQIAGMLEDFCIEMIGAEGRQAAEAAVVKAQGEGVTTFIAAHRSKAIAHTFLAWQDAPGRPLGQAITTQALQPQTLTARSFATWLTAVFEP